MKAIIYTKAVTLVLMVSMSLTAFTQNTGFFSSNNTLAESTMPQGKYSQPQIVNMVSNARLMQVEYKFNGFAVANKKVGKMSYQFLHVKDFGKMGEVGKPALPARNENVIIPTSQFEIFIQNANYTEYEGYKVHPALQDATDLAGDPEPVFEIDSVLYSTDEFYPKSIVECVNIGYIRGVQVATIQIRPIQFNPVTGKIRVYENIDYKIAFKGEQTNFEELNRKNSTNFLRTQSKTYINSNILPDKNEALSTRQNSNFYNIIIVTVDSLKQAADTLAHWKRQMGYSVEILSRPSWTTTMIKDSVAYRYNSWPVHPDYLILLGDAPMVPSTTVVVSTKYFYTDLYYVTMDGSADYYADMATGRISVINANQAMQVVQKIVNYERNPVNSSDFYSKTANCSYFQDGTSYTNTFDGYDDRRFLHTSEEARSYLMTKGYNVDRIYDAFANRNPSFYNNGYYSDGQPIPSDLLKSNGFTWTGNASNINSVINEGRFLVLHRDHGYTDGYGWEHPYYLNYEANSLVSDGNHINQLSNGDKLPVVLSINCSTGQFSRPECFAENFLRKQNGGAVGVIADSYTSYSGYNDAVAIGIYDAIWSNPGLIPDFGSGGFVTPNVNSHSDIFAMGDVMNQAMLRMTQTWAATASTKRQMELFHYFGDPSMKIWTANPTTISLNVPEIIERFADRIEISNSNCTDGVATLMMFGEVIGSVVLVNGNGVIEFDCDTTGEAILTITKHNFRPFIRKYNINNSIKNIAPIYQAANIQCIDNLKTKDVLVEWEIGDGDFRLVVINTENTFSEPQDGVDYEANSYYNDLGEQVVYNGNGNSVLIQNLDENTIYWIRVYEYNNLGIYTLYKTSTEINNPAPSIKSDDMLPIILVDFAAKVEANAVKLNWSTLTEINNSHFDVLKSTDLKTMEIVATIKGCGNSNVLRTYTTTDYNPGGGVVYYALRQVDYDGLSKTTDFISVNTGEAETNLIGILNQEPGMLNVFINGDMPSTIELLSIDGKVVFSQNLQSNSLTSINTSEYVRGVYVLKVVSNQLEETKKIILL